MKIDTHLHTDFSSDSLIKMPELIEKAIANNYEYICITEHFDLVPDELFHYGLLPLNKYFKQIEHYRIQYPQINLGFGLEIGEPHITKELRDKLLAFIEVDYLIGSLHLLKSKKNLSTPIDFPLQEDIIMQYYEEIIEMVEMGGFDTLGHLGIFKREINDSSDLDLSFIDKYLDKIFSLMIKNNICLEVNYSGYRSRLNAPLPDYSELAKYKALGGELITIGSDSHRIDFFNKFYDQTLDNLSGLGFKHLYYKLNNSWKSIDIRS